MSETNLEKLKRGQRLSAQGDIRATAGILDEDVDWGTAGRFPGTQERYRGISGVEEWMESLLSAWESFSIEIEEVIHEDGDLLVVAERLQAKGLGSGAEVAMTSFAVYWFARGKLVKRRSFAEREAALRIAGLER